MTSSLRRLVSLRFPSSMQFLDTAPNSARNAFRARRFSNFMAIVLKDLERKGRCRVIDLGGSYAFWQTYCPVMPDGLSVTIVNLDDRTAHRRDGFTYVEGDACCLNEIEDGYFDIVHSNSVIEHVGQWSRVVAFATEVRRLAPKYFVQTPNVWFPIEAHARYPLFQFLPEQLRAEMLMRGQRGFLQKASSYAEAMYQVQGIRLLSRREMRGLFPDGNITSERFFCLTKSIIAQRN